MQPIRALQVTIETTTFPLTKEIEQTALGILRGDSDANTDANGNGNGNVNGSGTGNAASPYSQV